MAGRFHGLERKQTNKPTTTNPRSPAAGQLILLYLPDMLSGSGGDLQRQDLHLWSDKRSVATPSPQAPAQLPRGNILKFAQQTAGQSSSPQLTGVWVPGTQTLPLGKLPCLTGRLEGTAHCACLTRTGAWLPAVFAPAAP